MLIKNRDLDKKINKQNLTFNMLSKIIDVGPVVRNNPNNIWSHPFSILYILERMYLLSEFEIEYLFTSNHLQNKHITGGYITGGTNEKYKIKGFNPTSSDITANVSEFYIGVSNVDHLRFLGISFPKIEKVEVSVVFNINKRYMQPSLKSSKFIFKNTYNVNELHNHVDMSMLSSSRGNTGPL